MAVFEEEAAVFQRPADAEKKLVFFKGLKDIVVSATTNGFEGGGDIVHGRDHDHRYLRIVRMQPGKQLQTVHFRHQHVAEHKVKRVRLEVLDCFPAVGDCGTRVPLGFKQGRDNLADGLLVVDD